MDRRKIYVTDEFPFIKLKMFVSIKEIIIKNLNRTWIFSFFLTILQCSIFEHNVIMPR